jgi:hypothetical protein
MKKMARNICCERRVLLQTIAIASNICGGTGPTSTQRCSKIQRLVHLHRFVCLSTAYIETELVSNVWLSGCRLSCNITRRPCLDFSSAFTRRTV